MTAKQRAARAKFKAVVKEAGKLRKKNPKLTQAEAVKQAWAISYSKESKGKKLGEYHKDTKSHNVNIRVVSGIKINYKRGKLGALPVNFTGKILGVKFRVYNQFNLDGSVTAQVVEDDPKGYTIVEINGRPGEAKAGAGVFYGMIERRISDNLTEQEDKIVKSRIFKFLDQLSKEVKAYNSGKDKRTKKNEKLVITTSAPKKAAPKKATAKKATGVKAKIKDILRSDKKRLKYGYTIVPGKVMAGISGFSGNMYAVRDSIENDIKRYNESIQRIKNEMPELTKVQKNNARITIKKFKGYIQKLKDQLRTQNSLIRMNLR